MHVMVTRLSIPPPKKRSREPEYKARNSSHAWSVASLWCNITLPLQGSACSDDNRDDESEVDVSFVSQSADDSLYLSTPERMVKDSIRGIAIVPKKVCFVDLTQLDKFMKQLNQMHNCHTWVQR